MYGANKKDIIVKTLEQKLKANIKNIAAIEVEMMKIVTAR